MQLARKHKLTDLQILRDATGNRALKTPEVAPYSIRKIPRILFLTRTLTGGGAERQLVTLALGLHRVGWEVAVACFYNSVGDLQTDLEKTGVRVIDLKKCGRWDVVGFIWRLMRVFRDQEPDIVHGYMHVANMLALLARFGGSGVRVVWGVRSSNMDWRRYNWLMRPTFWLSCKLARYVDCIIANSQAGADCHVACGYPRARVVVIPNGIDTDYFHFEPVGRDRLRAEWGISANEVLVGVVARLDPMKDHLTFLKAAALLTKRNLHWRFVCVGGGPASYTDELRTQARELGVDGRMIFTGARGDMAAVYSALDIASSSSSWGEGFPNVVAEAMACERPCVVTNVGDCARVIGECGVVVPARNPEMLADAIERYWARECRVRNGAHARARVSRLYSVEKLVASSAEVLRMICPGRGGTIAGVPSQKGGS